ncbi:glycosyltransferase family 2 protein [bacterium]|nr:glycosyltransferase family 2 protein [bacterium]
MKNYSKKELPLEQDKNTFVSVVIPTYNEEVAISEDLDSTIKALEASKWNFEVIMVDDGCTDRSLEIAKTKDVRIVCHPKRKGVGRARTTGVKAARGNIIVMTDADNTYPNHDIPRLVDAIDGYHMVIGARKTEEGTIPWLRKPMKAFIKKIAEYITITKIPDLNSGFRAFRKDVAENFFNLLPEGHSWVSTITIAFLSNSFDVKFIPIDYYKRKGMSSFHPVRDTYNMLLLVLRTIMYFKPLKIFFPTSLAIFIIGCIRTVYDAKVLMHIKASDIIIIMFSLFLGVLGLLADMIAKLHKVK